jgi:hypothetical protein
VLIVLLQLLAARLANLDGLVFHSVDSAGSAAYHRARSILENTLLPKGLFRRLLHFSPVERTLADVIEQIQGMGFRWGKGDGN